MNERKIGISAAFRETGSFGQSQHKTVHLCNDGSPSTASVVLTFLCDSDASGSQTGLVIRIIWSDFLKHRLLIFITGLLNQNSSNKSYANDPEVVSWLLLMWWSSGIDIWWGTGKKHGIYIFLKCAFILTFKLQWPT